MNHFRSAALVTAAFLGGACANFVLSLVPPAHAQDQAEPAAKVEAQAFVLKDKSGEVRATLSLNEGGMPALVLKDSQGTDRIEVALRKRPDGHANTCVCLNNEAGKTQQMLLSFAERGSWFSIMDESGKERIGAGTDAENSASIRVSSADGKRAIGLNCFETAPAEHKPKWQKEAAREKDLSDIWGSDEKPQEKETPPPPPAGPFINLRVFKDGTADLLMRDANNLQRVHLGGSFDKGTSSLSFMDNDERIVVQQGIWENKAWGTDTFYANGKLATFDGVHSDGTAGETVNHRSGKRAAEIGVSTENGAVVTLFTPEEVPTVILASEASMSSMALCDPKGKLRAALSSGPDTSLRLFGEEGKMRMRLLAAENGQTQMSFYGADEKIRILHGVFSDCAQSYFKDAKGSFRIMDSAWDSGMTERLVYDQNGKARIRDYHSDNFACRQLRDNNGKTRIQEVSYDDAGAFISTFDSEGNERIRTGYTASQAQLIIYDKKKKFRTGMWVHDPDNTSHATVRNQNEQSVWEEQGK